MERFRNTAFENQLAANEAAEGKRLRDEHILVRHPYQRKR